jgi:DNA-binding transcriptional ArsR family regulator
VRIVSGTGLELCAELAAFTSGPARASLESGKSWIRETRRLAGRELIERVSSHALGTWVGVASVAAELGDDVDIRSLLDHIASIDPDRLQGRLIGADDPMYRDAVDRELVRRAADGDGTARAQVRRLLADGSAGRREVDRLLGAPAADLRREMHEIMVGWADRVFPHWADEAMAAVGRDIHAKRALLSRAPAQEILAAAVPGLSFEPGAWVEAIVIAPSVALRPFVVPLAVGATAFFLASVSDEAMDPGGFAQGRLVRVAAALGDPIRLRALHELSHEDGLPAATLADRLGVERTTLHHHLGILRSAGLVGIDDRADGGWRYRVRRERIDEVGALLRSYLGGG